MEIKIRFEGRDLVAEAETINGVLWIHHNGLTRAIDTRAAAKSKSRAGGGEGSGELRAPMPGKITKIFKSTGEKVERGEAVVVMEAMKMEYTLKSDVAGTLESISCKAGDQVTLGQDLVRVKPEAKA